MATQHLLSLSGHLRREFTAANSLLRTARFWSGIAKVVLALGLSKWLRSLLRHFWWHRGMFAMLQASTLVNLRRMWGNRQRYQVMLYEHEELEEEYAVWWPERTSEPESPQRLWILVPGGMSDGDSVAGYFDELLQSGVIDKANEDWCLFHNAGTGGAEWRKQTYAGLSDPAFLLDYLKRLGAYSRDEHTKHECPYREIVILGFSVGGMLTLATADKIFNAKVYHAKPEEALQKPTLLAGRAQSASLSKDGHCSVKDGQQQSSGGRVSRRCTREVRPCRLRFVSVHSPDHLRNTFEAMTKWSWFARLDIPLALHFWAVNLRNRLIFKCPEGRLLPWPPTWSYIRHITEVAWAQNQVLKKQATGASACQGQLQMPFEHFEGDFSLQLRATLPAGEVLRIQNPEDPVVDRSTLDPNCLRKCDVWWFREGGHVMCFGASPKLACRLRKWVEHPPVVM